MEHCTGHLNFKKKHLSDLPEAINISCCLFIMVSPFALEPHNDMSLNVIQKLRRPDPGGEKDRKMRKETTVEKTNIPWKQKI